MKILISPFSRGMRGKPTENPKNYPLAFWIELIKLLEKKHQLIQIGIGDEPTFIKTHHFNTPIQQLVKLVKDCDTFISVDNFLPHMANYYKKKGFVIFGKSDPLIFGYKKNINILKTRSYLRIDQFGMWESTEYNADVFMEPQQVFKIVNTSIRKGF